MKTFLIPADIGDKIYFLKRAYLDEDFSVVEETIKTMTFMKDDTFLTTEENPYRHIKLTDVGKTMFFDKNEAEKELKKHPIIPKKAFIRMEINFFTDGDYSLEKYKDLGFTSAGDGYTLNFEKEFARTSLSNVQQEARDFLEKVFASVRVGYTHYYIMKDIYNLFDNAINAVFKEEKFYEEIGGNYEGTNIYFEIREEV